MASAASLSYVSTKETTNYARLCRLLVDAGSQALRNKFDSIHPPTGLHGVLTKPPAHPILQTLRKKRILNPTQWGKLYPPTPASVSSKDFDITLLMLLLRNICGLTPPTTGWDNLPPAADTSAEANIARVKYYRNHVYGHASQASVDDATFNTYWQDVSNALVGLGADAAAINTLKTESMDPVIEKHYQELLREWKKDDDSSKDTLEEIQGTIKCFYVGNRVIQSNLQLVYMTYHLSLLLQIQSNIFPVKALCMYLEPLENSLLVTDHLVFCINFGFL